MRALILVLLITVISLVGVCSYVWFNQPKVAYIELTAVYKGFTMTKELDNSLKGIQNERQNYIDSIHVLLQKMESDLSKRDSFEVGIARLEQSAQVFNESNNQIADKYQEQIWKQLNSYITEFGANQDLDILFGANGSGTIMYVDSTMNRTNEVINYINKRYEGQGFK